MDRSLALGETQLPVAALLPSARLGGRDRVWSRDLLSWAICSPSPIATSSSDRGVTSHAICYTPSALPLSTCAHTHRYPDGQRTDRAGVSELQGQ